MVLAKQGKAGEMRGAALARPGVVASLPAGPFQRQWSLSPQVVHADEATAFQHGFEVRQDVGAAPALGQLAPPWYRLAAVAGPRQQLQILVAGHQADGQLLLGAEISQDRGQN